MLLNILVTSYLYQFAHLLDCIFRTMCTSILFFLEMMTLF
jgi:hypothetical protein